MSDKESLRISYDSNVAGLVEKDAAALEKLGDVAEVTERKITKTSRTVAGDARKFDDITKATNAFDRALKDLRDTEDRQNSALAAGDITTEEYTRTMAGAQRAAKKAADNLAKAKAKWAELESAQKSATTTMSATTAASGELSAAQLAQLQSGKELAEQFRAGKITAAQYREELQDIGLSFAMMGTSAEAATRNILAQRSALKDYNQSTAATAQSKINSWAGVSTPGYGQSDARQADFEAAAQDAEKLRAQLVPLAAAQQEYAEAQEKAGAALAANIISQQEYDAYVGKAKTTLDRQTASLRGNAGAAKLTAFELGILADEAHKFFDQVLAGGNPLQAAFYQAPNMIQVAGGLRAALTRITSALSGPGALIAGATAAATAIAAMGYASESEQQQLAQLSTHLRATRTDYAQMADAAEKAARSLHESDSDLSLSDSRTAVQTIVSVPTVDSSQIERYMTDARNLAAVMGETVPEAARTMASALQDPAKAAEEFAQQGMPGFSAGLVLMVQHMQEAGNRTGALNSVLKVLEQTTRNAEDQALTPFQASLKNLKDETGGVGDTVVYAFQHMGDGIVGMATAGINALTDLIGLVEQIPGKVESVASGIWDTVKEGGSWLENGVERGLDAVGATGLSSLMDRGYSSDPTFSMPANTNATGASQTSATTAAVEAQTAATTKNTAAWEENRKEIDAMAGTDSSLSGQISDHQRKIQGLTTAIAKLKAMGPMQYDPKNPEAYTATLKNLTGQLQAEQVALGGLRGPFAELLEQQDRAAQSAAALTGYDKAMVEASQQADDAARELSGGLASASEKALVQAAAARTLAAEYTTNLSVIARNTQLQDGITDAWAKGGAAADHATNYVEAYNYALDHFSKNAPDFNEKVKAMTAELDAFSASKRNTALSQETFANDNQIKLIGLETDTLGMNADARTKLINRMQAENAETEKGNSLQDQSVQAYLASVDALSDATTAYEHHQQVLQDVTGSLENMTDQLTDGVTQGFLQGTSSGMSFKTTLQGITTQIVGMLAKMALINPLLNKIDGGTRTTLDEVTDMLSGSSSASNAGTDKGLDQQDQEALQNWFGEKTQSGSQGSTDGLDQQDKSSLNQLFGAGQGGSSGLSGLMSTKLFGTASVGSLLTGVGSGMAVGSLFSHVGSGTDGTLGSAIGSGVGSIVGSIFPGVGTVLGGIIGGAGGGLLGSLFGGKHHYTIDDVSAENGALSISRVHNHRNTDSITSPLQDDLDSLNQLYSDVGASVSDSGVVGQVYAKRYRGKHSNQTLADILPDIDLTSSDATFAKALAGGMPSSFDSVDTYAQTVQQLKQTSDALDALGVHVSKFTDATHVSVESISGYTGDLGKVLAGFDGKTISTDALQTQISSLKGLLDVTDSGAESIVSQVADLRDKYQQAADQAKAYGLDYQTILDKGNAIAEMTIANERRKLDQADQSVQARDMAATGNQEGADLLNQQVSAAQEIQQLQDNWRAFLGDSYASNTTYQQQLSDLEKTQADERLQIQKQYDQKSIEAALAAAEQRNEAWASIQSMKTSWQAADMTANGNKEGADLLNFDTSASQQKSQLDALAKTYWGDNYATQKQYQDMMLQMDKSLTDQRLQIQRQYEEQSREAWASIQSTQTSWQAADLTANGNQEGADLLNFDASASQQKSQLDALAKTYWGDNYATQKQYQDMVLEMDKSLTDQRLQIQKQYDQKSIEAAQAAAEQRNEAWASIQSMKTSWQAADMTANGNKEGADLLNFDTSASQQKSQLDALAKTYWGDNYATQKQYQDMVLEMEKSLTDQRLQIQKQYADQALAEQAQAAQQQQQYVDQAQQSIASIFSGLTTYITGLETSDASPLSAQDQYTVANDNFLTDYKAAMGGDYDALSRMQTDAQTVLGVGKTYYGSGTDYASLFNTVTVDLGNLVNANLTKMQQTLITKEKSSNSTSLADTVKDLVKQVQELVSSNKTVASTIKMNTLVAAQAGKAS